MQGKEASEQESSKCTAGIDVSKDWLDAHIMPADKSLRVANTREGIRKLKRWLVLHEPELVVVEATGKWHRVLCRSLHASAIAVAVSDPYRVRMFAKARGILAKTDKIDARVLAQFAAVMAPTVRPPASQALEALQELVTAQNSAVAERTALKNQLVAAESAFLKSQLTCRIKELSVHVAAIRQETLRRIKADEGLAKRYAILTSVPGFGPIAAETLIACLAELGTVTDKQASSLAGLAPVANDSGQRKGARSIWGGRAIVRKILYLAAVSASRCNADMKIFYQRLIANGKAPKAALIAVARKLLVLANTLITQNRTWQPTAPKIA